MAAAEEAVRPALAKTASLLAGEATHRGRNRRDQKGGRAPLAARADINATISKDAGIAGLSQRNTLPRRSLRPLAAAALLLVTLVAAGCAPAPSYSSLSDDEVKRLFPTEAEIQSAVGDISDVSGPISATVNKSPNPPQNNDLSPECTAALYGDPKSYTPPTRIFILKADGQDGTRLTWALMQRSSADEMRSAHEDYKSRIAKCEEFYEPYDPGTSAGVGYGIKKSGSGLVEGAVAVVVSGDTQLAFVASGVSYQKAEELARKMAPVMEKRLKDSAPKR